ncbi:hypothetical protein A2935_01595 [Candidatus Wolfebacteria bacterium RIFCSPLOWO2_01_FULL_47_17b]|uniref:Nudix hydrolase domain-containing protein n=1 Tax=Candidatus Wolfebacteria bacterium RIFCSPLOWO2_01_FULL_47_17b TaxID=1802558 RepID=A0A1F8DYV0_9BACT|nr:MAG: hypothetical protein A2935_01595 [Candidatus Wolfebacteria bacterium RIFCSPLOWO2_01_FULL_47_17b]
MAKACDNTSGGILIRKGEDILMIERKKNNFGMALPAGHLDGDTSGAGTARELDEETGLIADELTLRVEKILPNPCKRDGGTHHAWSIFEATHWHGDVRPSESEVKSYFWASPQKIKELSKKLEDFAREKKIRLIEDNLPSLVKETNEDPSWISHPGLEPPMYFLFKELKII